MNKWQLNSREWSPKFVTGLNVHIMAISSHFFANYMNIFHKTEVKMVNLRGAEWVYILIDSKVNVNKTLWHKCKKCMKMARNGQKTAYLSVANFGDQSLNSNNMCHFSSEFCHQVAPHENTVGKTRQGMLCDNYVPQWWVEFDDELSWLFTKRFRAFYLICRK